MDPELADVSTALLDEAEPVGAPGRAHAGRRQRARLRQTAIALLEGSSLSDHENPGRRPCRCSWGGCASRGPTRRSTSARAATSSSQERHGLLALTDAVVLLTAAMT